MSLTHALNVLAEWWPGLAAALHVLAALAASGHAVVRKRDVRAAVGWTGVNLLVPLLGPLLYVLLGINRIERRARSVRGRSGAPDSSPPAGSSDDPGEEAQLEDALLPSDRHLKALADLGRRVTGRPLLAGNQVEPLIDGDEAFPAMLRAIESGKRSVTLATYIFDDDRVGRTFVDALARAVGRGVAVRVLIDAVGARYSRPPITRRLGRHGVPFALFMPTLWPWRWAYSNLRNHRKILVVDGRVGFTGGINFREDCELRLDPAFPTQDLHFRVEGPLVAEMQEVFLDDWAFCTGEELRREPRFMPPTSPGEPRGGVPARAVPDGPDRDFEKARGVRLGALACARRSVQVVTPYFLPDGPLTAALNTAALRGVEVDIVLPQVNNLKLVQWASTAQLRQILEQGCRVWLSPPPFDHGKLMLVDGAWSLLGSSNWDARSLRLNFEFDVECYDRRLASALAQVVTGKMARSRPLGLADVDARRLPVKVRDGLARLLAPYL